MKKAVMYGAGNIGRGFIGATLSRSGYYVTFVDVAEQIVCALRDNGSYPVRYVSDGDYEEIRIENVTAIDGRDSVAVAEAIAQCDILATAVGSRVLERIAPNIVQGLRARWQKTREPLNILICENLNNADKALEALLKQHMTADEQIMLDKYVGLVETSIGRMVPVQTEQMRAGDPTRVCVERYGYLPTDRAAFKGEIPQISNMIPFTPFDFYIKRKLYIHNMGHACCAYLGGYEGRKYVYQAIDNPEILGIVQNAMLESAIALHRCYAVELNELLTHITDLLGRFRNSALQDTCKRVAADPARKLGKNDRLIGAALLCLREGETPAYIAVGAAGALYRYLQETGEEQTEQAATKTLLQLTGLPAEHTLVVLIMKMYRLFMEGEELESIRHAAQKEKSDSISNVI